MGISVFLVAFVFIVMTMAVLLVINAKLDKNFSKEEASVEKKAIKLNEAYS